MNTRLQPRTPRAAPAALLLGVLCAGCRSGAQVPATATPEPILQPSATMLFPAPAASPTLTPAPSPTPTVDLAADLAGLLFQDDFSQELGWTQQAGTAGAVSLLPDRLVIAVRRPGAMLQSLSPAPEAEDFLLQAEVRTELCGQSDEFGVMFRVLPNGDHYRFSLTCDGQARVSRFRAGQEAALAPLTATAAAHTGAPSSNTLAVWARADQFRFLVNQVEVFALRDGTLRSGGFGVAVRSRRSPQITVSFHSFEIYALHPASD